MDRLLIRIMGEIGVMIVLLLLLPMLKAIVVALVDWCRWHKIIETLGELSCKQ